MTTARREAYLDAVTAALISNSALCVLVFVRPPAIIAACVTLVLSLGLGMGGAVVLHHAGHGRFSRRWYLNAAWVHAAAPVGLWVHHWGMKHRIHHKLPAVYPADRYTTGNMFVRLHPAAPWRPMHRYQHIYIILGYAIYWLSETASQVRYVISGSMPYSQDNSNALRRTMLFLSEKAMCAIVLLPYFLIGGDGWRIVWLLLIAGTIGSIYAGLVVGAGHINIGLSPTEQPPNGAKWIGYVLSSTASFSVDSRVAGWLTGGLTLHAAHHLRPLACRRELRSLHSELKGQSVTGQALIEFASFARALSGHFAALRLWGKASSNATKQTVTGYLAPAASLDSLTAARAPLGGPIR